MDKWERRTERSSALHTHTHTVKSAAALCVWRDREREEGEEGGLLHSVYMLFITALSRPPEPMLFSS